MSVFILRLFIWYKKHHPTALNSCFFPLYISANNTISCGSYKSEKEKTLVPVGYAI